jgi:hypothetical protein
MCYTFKKSLRFVKDKFENRTEDPVKSPKTIRHRTLRCPVERYKVQHVPYNQGSLPAPVIIA